MNNEFINLLHKYIEYLRERAQLNHKAELERLAITQAQMNRLDMYKLKEVYEQAHNLKVAAIWAMVLAVLIISISAVIISYGA